MYSPCTYNRIFENNVVDNVYDGMIEAMPGNTTFFNNSVFHNNFVNSMYPFIYKVSGNIWDNGYPSGGNYWSQYNGTDSHSGLHQNETGSDGMGDTPYLLDFFEADRYPLIHPYGSIRNLNTSLIYLAIQSAIDASDTLNGQTLQVSSGTYYEHVSIDKSLKLVGENRTTTIIDGAAIGTVLYVNADNVSITGFTIANSGLNYPPYGNDCGVLLNHSNGSKISDSLVMNNRIGIYVFFSRSSFIERNAISSNLDSGIWLWYSGNNTLTQNEISNNTYNFGVFGGSSSDFNNSISDTNTVDGRPIRYLSNVKDEIIDEQIDIGALYLINCVNITVRNLNLSKNGQGLFCYNVTESRIENVTALRNNYGICLQDSNDDTIGNSSCLNNWVGIYLQGSDHNVIENSITANCEKGISLYEASYNNLSGNTISDNLYGIRFFSSHSNRIVDNNLIENSEQVDMINSYQDTWDNGFEGNFWSNYNGSDTNRDGVGETSHVINTDNSDGYPLLGQFSNFVIHANGSSFRFAIISNSTILGFNYYDTNSTIRLTVNGTDGTDGFCRMRIPRALASSEISVIIDDGSTEVLYPNYTLRDDGYYRWVYFAYHHSQHEILVIPEFASLTLLAAIMATACCCLLFRTRKTDRRNARRTCACLGQ
jgi:parallel beta-helix repeat protein